MRVFMTLVLGKADLSDEHQDVEDIKEIAVINYIQDLTNIVIDLVKNSVDVQLRITNLPPRTSET